MLLQEFELVNGKRLVRHFDERLRNRLGDRPQPRGQTSRKNGNRKAHASRTFVPSKSKRNRTSSRPALHIARTEPSMVLRVEQEEAAAAGPDQLAPERSVLESQLVPLVDVRVAHAAGAPLLLLPLLVHQRAEAAECRPSSSASRERSPSSFTSWRLASISGIVFLAALLLVGQDAAGASREAGEEQQQVVLEIEQRVHRHAKRLGLDAAVAVEREAGHAAKRRDVLVLLPDRLGEAVDLDVARQFGEFVRMEETAPVRVERLQERRGEAPRRSESRSRRDVGERRDLDLRRSEVEFAKRLADQAMLHVVDALDVLQLEYFRKMPWMNGRVTVT